MKSTQILDRAAYISNKEVRDWSKPMKALALILIIIEVISRWLHK